MGTMARSMLVTEIYIKATEAQIGSEDDSAALTLMSTDMERIQNGFRSLHTMWASVIQIAISCWMLYLRLGVAFVVPVSVVAGCFAGLTILMRFAGKSQRTWMAAVQRRIGMTSTVIASMKNLKISGLAWTVKEFVQKLRVDELTAGTRFREILIIAAMLGYIPMILGPPATLAAAQRTLDPTRMFTSLSYLLLLTSPLSQVFQATPQLLAALACLARVQAYLEQETRQDFRQIEAGSERKSEKAHSSSEVVHSASQPNLAPPLRIREGAFGWERGKFVLRDINTTICESSLTIVVGPVASGKSTLCKALLGEIPFREGSVVLNHRHPHVGYCDQTAFLSNGSIKDNIIGFSPFDSQRYAEVIEATSLHADLAALPLGDRSNVGSDGITLSGGQRQRVSLARALYLQTDLLVLDDVFSGLDADTEEQVFRNVFGPDGLLRQRGCTVVLCTHSIRHLPAADHIIALGDGTILEQGTFEQLASADGYVQRLGLSTASDSDDTSEKMASKKSGAGPEQRLHLATVTTGDPLDVVVDESRRAGDKTVYKHYLRSMGWILAGFCLLFGCCWGFFTNFPIICEYRSSSERVVVIARHSQWKA